MTHLPNSLPLETSTPLSSEDALRLADLGQGEAGQADLAPILEAARAIRDRAWTRRITFSPKVFLPLTNLCKNRCSYCSFRKGATQAGAWTMTPPEVASQLDRARLAGCAEALFCLGDKPESAFPTYRETLAGFGFEGTVDYLCASADVALAHGLLPHTNAGILTYDDMARLKENNVSLGLMLETASDRLCGPGMPHEHAPDKRPDVRIRMIDEAGQLAIPFTTGILIGIGETRRERIEALLAIRALHEKHGHIQEVIVQNFRATPKVPMRNHHEPDDIEIAHAIAMARLILPEDVSLQAPPNLNAANHQSEGAAMLLNAGINDFGGISPVTPDYINPRHPWPQLESLADVCMREGYTLFPRLPIYDRYIDKPGFLHPNLRAPTARCAARLARVKHPSDLALTRTPHAEELRV